MTYPPFGSQPPPDHRLVYLEGQVDELRKKTKQMNRSLWALGIIVLVTIVLPFVYGFVVTLGAVIAS